MTLEFQELESPIIVDPETYDLLITSMTKIDAISKRRWCFYRNLYNDYEFIEHGTLACNRAFWKLHEIIRKNPCLLPEDTLQSLHLCEAPGSFIQVLQNCKLGIDSWAISKKPTNNVNDIPRFDYKMINNLKNGHVYLDYIDITNKIAISRYVSQLLLHVPTGFSFITADGGIDEGLQYSKKESFHYKLIFAEIVTALLLQKTGGNFVLKVFDLFTSTSYSILEFLRLHYEELEIVKPATSRPTNSERYILMRNFKGLVWSRDNMLNLLDYNIASTSILNIPVPEALRRYIKNANKVLSLRQIYTINQIMSNLNIFIDFDIRRLEKRKIFEKWLDTMKLKDTRVTINN